MSGIWVCDNCGFAIELECEVACWVCGCLGEMVYTEDGSVTIVEEMDFSIYFQKDTGNLEHRRG